MTISEVAIKRPVLTTMLTLAWVVLGTIGLMRLGTDLFPEVKFPFVTVMVPYPGAAPEDVERQVVKPVEDAVVAANGVDQIHAWARENVGIVAVQFKLNVDFDTATSEIRDKVGAIRHQLPDGAEEPVITKADIGAAPILVYAASAPRPSEEVRKITEDYVKPALEQIPGVAKVDIIGGREREIHVDLDPVKLESFGLSPAAVVAKLKAENATIPAGHYTIGATQVGVRTVGDFRSVDDVRNAVLFAMPDGKQVTVGSVATVTDDFKERKTLIRANAQDAVAFQVVKASGSNTVAVSADVKKALKELETKIPATFAYKVEPLIDQSTYIEANAHEVKTAIAYGGAMAILTILIFMMDLRSTFISALALPTAVIGTFLMMYVLGFSLNMMTLLGLSLAIGLLIDDAVVVRENIFRHLEMGEEPEIAAANGTREITLAVFATTMTIVAVFVPIAFMPGIVGQFFRQFGLTVTAAVLLSMVVAFTLDPMLSARLAKRIDPTREQHGHKVPRNALASRVAVIFETMDAAYHHALRWSVSHPKTVVAGAFASFVIAMGMAASLGADFASAEDRGQFILNLEYPADTSLAETSRRSLEVEKALLADKRYKIVYATIGPDEEANKVRMRVDIGPKEDRPLGVNALKKNAMELARHDPKVKVTTEEMPMIEGLGEYNPIMIAVSGPDYAVLAPLADKVERAYAETPGAADVKEDYTPGKREARVIPLRGEAGEASVAAATLGWNVHVAMDGEVAGKLRGKNTRGEDDETDIRVQFAPEFRGSPDAVARIPVNAGQGTVHVGEVARIEPGTGPAVIHREARSRAIMVQGGVLGRDLNGVFLEAKSKIDKLPPDGYHVTWLGNVKDMQESNASFGEALGVAIIFIYIVLASQFESFVHPATIMLSLPLALVGAFGALFLYRSPLAMGSQIGIILLMGLVTKNAILLVDSALAFMRDDRKTPMEAMLAAGPKRLRPILMTSAAMILGMVPTAFGRGAGSEFRAPMAIAVIGGVISSTFLTLLVVPVVFLYVERMRAWVARQIARLRGKAPESGVAVGVLALVAAGALLLVAVPRGAHAADAAGAASAPASASKASTKLTLDEAMDLAARTSPDLAAAAEKITQAQDDVRSAWAFFLPQVTAQGSYLWYDRDIKLAIPGGPVLDLYLQKSPTHAGQIVGTLPLFNPQGFPTLAAARHGEKATEAAVAQGRQELLLGVAQAYWANVVTADLVKASDEAVANAKELSRVAGEQVKAQVTTNLALYRARAAEEQAQQFAISARGAQAQAAAALRRLTGVEGPIEVEKPAALPPPSVLDEDTLWAQAKTKRPDLRAANEALLARGSLANASYTRYLPFVAAQAERHYTSNEGLTGFNYGGSYGFVASWTLFDGNLREQAMAKARSQRREAQAQLVSGERKARQELSGAITDLQTALATRDAAKEGAEFARQAQALAQSQYRAGTATNLEVTNANATLLQAEASLAQAEAQAAVAQLALKAALGDPLH